MTQSLLYLLLLGVGHCQVVSHSCQQLLAVQTTLAFADLHLLHVFELIEIYCTIRLDMELCRTSVFSLSFISGFCCCFSLCCCFTEAVVPAVNCRSSLNIQNVVSYLYMSSHKWLKQKPNYWIHRTYTITLGYWKLFTSNCTATCNIPGSPPQYPQKSVGSSYRSTCACGWLSWWIGNSWSRSRSPWGWLPDGFVSGGSSPPPPPASPGRCVPCFPS